MSCRSYFFVFFLLVFSWSAVAQQSGCSSLEVPVNVIKASGEPVPGLSSSDFLVQIRKNVVSVDSITPQSAPRRILLVLDTTRKLAPDARKLEVEFAQGVVDAAQPEDSFALITARGLSQAVKFGSDRAALNTAFKTLLDAAGQSGDNHAGPLDAVTEGIGWFEQPQLGDSIILLALDLEDNRKATPKTVGKLLQDHHIRLFGVALGPLQLQNSASAGMATDRDGFGYRQPGVPMNLNLGEPNFLPLSVNSGGYVAPENTHHSSSEFKLTDPIRQQVRSNGARMAQLIDNVYVLRIKSPAHPEPWAVTLAPGKLQSMPGAHLLYPHEAPVCSASMASR